MHKLNILETTLRDGSYAFNSRILQTNQARDTECFFVVQAKEYIELCKIYFDHPDSELYCSDIYCNENSSFHKVER